MAYSKETLSAYVKNMKAIIDGYAFALQHETALKVAISYGNSKIGRVMNVSTAPIIACGKNCKGCKGICYDIKAGIQYTNVMKARARNTAMAKKARELYFQQIDTAMSRRRKNKYFRWHVAGDILDMDYLARMIENAVNHPDFIIWTYTKQYDIVNEYVRTHGGSIASAIPSNMVIMFSEWRGIPMHNPYGFPEFRVVFKTDKVKPSGFYCPGNCDFCKQHHCGCIAGQTVYCNEH